MSDGPDGVASVLLDTTADNVNKLATSSSPSPKGSFRVLGQGKSVHEVFGGGKTADVLLWRKKHLSAALLIGTTIAWVLFHWLQCTLLYVSSNLLLLALVTLFGWSNAAALLNRAPPPIPRLQLSEETVRHVAKTLQIEINKALVFIHDVALGKDLVMFLKVKCEPLDIFSRWRMVQPSDAYIHWCHCCTYFPFCV